MEKLGLDNYTNAYNNICKAWIASLVVCGGLGVWWATADSRAIFIPVLQFSSAIFLIISIRLNKRYSLITNLSLKVTILAMGIILLSTLGLSIWASVDFQSTKEIITNLIVLWTTTLGMLLTYTCFALPLGVVFWNMRKEDLIKAQNIGGKSVVPSPLPLSSRQDENIIITLK